MTIIKIYNVDYCLFKYKRDPNCINFEGTSQGEMDSKLDWQTITSEFESH